MNIQELIKEILSLPKDEILLEDISDIIHEFHSGDYIISHYFWDSDRSSPEKVSEFIKERWIYNIFLHKIANGLSYKIELNAKFNGVEISGCTISNTDEYVEKKLQHDLKHLFEITYDSIINVTTMFLGENCSMNSYAISDIQSDIESCLDGLNTEMEYLKSQLKETFTNKSPKSRLSPSPMMISQSEAYEKEQEESGE